MKALDFVFALVKQHVPIESQQLSQMQIDGSAWYSNIGKTTEEGTPSHPLLLKFKEISDQWYAQLFLAVAFIFANKYVHEMLTGTADDEDDDDDE